MSNPPWTPLSQRGNPPAEPEVPYEGIPEHLAAPLWRWLERWEHDPEEILLAFRIPQEATDDSWDDLGSATFDNEALWLDVIDFVLSHDRIPPTERPAAVERLQGLLDRGGSAWRVADDGRALERRIDSTVAESVRHAAPQSSSAGEHLTTAWRAAYGRQPDPGKAYGEAIKAVEAAAIPVVEPKHAKATLGTVLGALNARPSDWELAILGPDRIPCDPEPVLAMIELLWQGQSDRHAGNLPTVPIPAAASLMAVHLAATLVHWFSTGAIRKKS